MKNVLITGASGFIGRRLAARLSESDLHISVTGAGRTKLSGPWISFIKMDLSGGQEIPNLNGFDTIFHLASKAHAVSEKPGSNDGYREVIVDGTRRLVKAAEGANVRSLIYMSSVKAMGEGESRKLETVPLNENSPTTPQTPYGCCKLEAEQIVIESNIEHVVVLRPVMVYGPGHKGNLVRMAEAIRRGRFPSLPENRNRRSMVHVDDLVSACERATLTEKANRNTYIVGGKKVFSTRELYNALRKEMGMNPVNWSVPGSLLIVIAKLGDALGSITGKRMPLDSDTLWKLLGSSWYSSQKSQDDLGLEYENDARPFLET